MNFKKYVFVLLFAALALASKAQTGSVHWVFTANDGSQQKADVAIPYGKYGTYDNYWFINPHTDKSFTSVVTSGKVIINFTSHRDTDIARSYVASTDDNLQLHFTNGQVSSWVQPDNDKGPVHIHIITFNAGELYFTFEGPAFYDAFTGVYNSSPPHVQGTVTGSVHVYRDPRYEQSAKLPGCNCDPTIYATVANAEDGRTASDCETAYQWKIFTAMKAALSPITEMLSPPQQSTAAPGSILDDTRNLDPFLVDMGAITTPNDYCNPFNHKFSLVAMGQENKILQPAKYGYTFIIMQSEEGVAAAQQQSDQAIAAAMPAMTKLIKQLMNKEITQAEYERQMALVKPKPVPAVKDFKLLDANEMLRVKVQVNETGYVQFPVATPKALGAVQHNIPGSAFELSAPLVKLRDGNWLPNRVYVLFGKFSQPRLNPQDNSYEIADAIIPPNGGRLKTYNMLITLTGKPELVNQALAKIDFATLAQMIGK